MGSLRIPKQSKEKEWCGAQTFRRKMLSKPELPFVKCTSAHLCRCPFRDYWTFSLFLF